MCEEWGDKSQFAAIALAANYGVIPIIIGGCLAHSCCILIALLLGVIVEKNISEKWINLMGGILFVLFGLYELIFNLILYQE